MVAGQIHNDTLPDRDVARQFYARYEPKEILGRGASSNVRRCIEKQSGREFAAKIVDVSSSDISKEATRSEISILRKVSGHRHIVQLHDVVECPSLIFLILELCPRGELFDYLALAGRVSVEKTRQIMMQLLDAVSCMRERGVVHRDIKPENILLDDDFNVKITDFGFAIELGANEPRLREVLGTPAYLAPELLKASMYENQPGYGHEIDVWACGVIMFTLLAGFHPFRHRKQMLMLRSIMEGRYEFKSPEWDDVADTTKDLVRRLLTVDPQERITARDALEHPFFHGDGQRKKSFNAKKTFHLACFMVRATIRIQRLRVTP